MSRDDDSYSSWLLDEAVKYADLSLSATGESNPAMMYYKGLSDGFYRARRRYLEGEQS